MTAGRPSRIAGRMAQIMAHLDAHPTGVTMTALVVAIRAKERTVRTAVDLLIDEGCVVRLIGPYSWGRRLVMSQHAETARADLKRCEAATVAAADARRRKANARRIRNQRKARLSVVEEFVARPFVHRVVSAAEAPALQKNGPASVFDLAGWI